MCAKRDAIQEMLSAAQCLTQACEGKIATALHLVYDSVLQEPVPPEFDELLSRMK